MVEPSTSQKKDVDGSPTLRILSGALPNQEPSGSHCLSEENESPQTTSRQHSLDDFQAYGEYEEISPIPDSPTPVDNVSSRKHYSLEPQLSNVPDRPPIDCLQHKSFDHLAKELRSSIEYTRKLSSVKRNQEKGSTSTTSRMSRKISTMSNRSNVPLAGTPPTRLKGSLKKPPPAGLPQYTLNIPIEGLDPDRKTIQWDQYDDYCDDAYPQSTRHCSFARQLFYFFFCICCVLPGIVTLILFCILYPSFNEYDKIGNDD